MSHSAEFNALQTASDNRFKNMLQEILDALPQKIAEMKQGAPAKDILMTLVPMPEIVDMGMIGVQQMLFDFNQKLASLPSSPDLQIGGTMGAHGAFIYLSIFTARENMLCKLDAADEKPEDWIAYYNVLKAALPVKEYTDYMMEKSDLDTTGYRFLLAVAQNMDPNALPPATYIHGRDEITLKIEGRVHFWQVNDGWKKPALEQAPKQKPAANKP